MRSKKSDSNRYSVRLGANQEQNHRCLEAFSMPTQRCLLGFRVATLPTTIFFEFYDGTLSFHRKIRNAIKQAERPAEAKTLLRFPCFHTEYHHLC